jgi:hypothetical protein
MNESQFLNMFRDAESYGFLPVPVPVPPMIEEAFGYRGRSQYVELGFGVHGGVLGDLVGDAERPFPADLYRKFLLHFAIKPYTNAFRIDIDPPAWLKSMDIGEFESRKEDFENWSKQSRCLLLDRERRQFSVRSVHEVRSWLILRGALYKGGQVPNRPHLGSLAAAVQALFAWLNRQTPAPVSSEHVAEWERKFAWQQTIAACTGAGFRLGFDPDDIKTMLRNALHVRRP